MAIISKIAFSTSVLFTFVMLGTFLIGTGCEQILDEALQEKITVEEELFGSQDHENGDSERVLVVGEFAILGAAPSAFAKPGESAFLVVPSDAGRFAWVCSEAGGELRGHLVNISGNPVAVTVSLGRDDNAAAAMVIGSVMVPGQSEQQFCMDGSDFEAFFDGLFAERSQEFYLYLTVEGDGMVDLTVRTLEFVLQPSHVIRREIGPVAELEGVSSDIEEISGVSLSGTVYNFSGAPLRMLLVLMPEALPAPWNTVDIAYEIPAGGSVEVSDLTGLLSGEQLNELQAMLAYLSTGAVSAELYVTTDTGLHYEIISIFVSGAVSMTF